MLTSTVCAAVSAAGLGIAALTAYRKRFLAATRIAAYALIPIGLVLTGVVDWLTGLVLKPSVWAGFAVLALSAVLFAASRAVERRRGGSRKERRAAAAAAGRDAVAPAASAPSLGPARTERPAGRAKAKAPAQDGEDFSDIEAILKKHGI
ncbi:MULTISPECIES: hypothetical protein [Streptomyces]|uniref:Uncharacterized protein n=1 Tax=Streptomyces morookaense TaxID=1970 RepID=A0A7Y7B7Y5_STRMO|nr:MULTISPECIES: hypothetical protein [Streptomyces]MCC2276471.1 hypothetical protein [Streptomyces sp. ET3-23]NVK80690.1 hypothetical protein [Streptomyces morookaense]GHF52005.1 hypothetical protein GCM10010359_63010 [Streptomyces morookaense]